MLKHVPQLVASVLVLVHVVPHMVIGAEHVEPPVHVPPVQLWPPVQALPHEPQLLLSVFGSMHVPLHGIMVPVQVLSAHRPPEHTCDAQVIPHVPQLFGSVVTSTHTPLHT